MPKPTDSVSETPASTHSALPGWYDDESGRQRWWDGSAWQQFDPGTPSTRKRRTIPLWLGVSAAVLALLIGSGIGRAGASAPSVASSVEYQKLVSENEVLESGQDQLTEEKAELEDGVRAVETQQAEIDTQTAALEARELAVKQGEEALAAAQAAPAPAPVVAPQPAPAPAPSAYYDNCDAVRAAGASPLYAGQPGYETPRLDRDGDGVACE